MTENKENKMQKHGYYEVYVPVWNPIEGTQPVNLTVDIYGNEELLDDIGVGRAVRNYSSGDISDMQEYERIIGSALKSLIEDELIMDVYCDEFGIGNVEDLEEKLDKEYFEVFPM